MVAENAQYWPEVVKAKEVIDSGAIGEPVTARPLADMQGESLARALLAFRSGVIAAFDAIYLDSVFAPDDMWRVTGTTGELTISSRGGGLWLWNASRRRGELLLQSGGYPKSFGGEMKDFAAAVLDGSPLKAGSEVSLGELRTALAIYRSAQTAAWESVCD